MQKEYIKNFKVSDLKPYDKNPRDNKKAIDYVIKSIKRNGNIDPVEVDEDNVILTGHTRRLAFLKMGVKEVDVIKVSGLTDKQKKTYRVEHNKTNEHADWLDDMVFEEIGDDDAEDMGFMVSVEDKVKAEVKSADMKFTDELLESHNYIVMYFDNDMDWQSACAKLKIGAKHALDSKEGYVRAGIGRVVNGGDVIKRIADED